MATELPAPQLDAMLQLQTEDDVLARLAPLQEILCCPATRADLALVSRRDLLARVHEPERARVSAAMTGAFVSEAAGLAYPIVGTIASFLDRDALRLTSSRTSAPVSGDPEAEKIKDSVKGWYDQFGWKKNVKGVYHDTATFSQDTPTGHGWYELASHLGLLDRLGGGRFLIDAASGAIPHPEYLAYSWFHQFRLCIDMSLTALQEAEQKIGDRGFCCLADICRLPIRDSSIDGAVSGYTIQHIPESQQAQAVRELFRVLRPAASLCVITDIRLTRWHRGLVFTARAVRKVLKTLRLVRPPLGSAIQGDVAKQPHPLYCVTHDWTWWRDLGRELTDQCSVECIRLFQRYEYHLLFGDSTRWARVIRAVETCFPRFLARASAYCLVDLRKG